jgi:hypothetical protein
LTSLVGLKALADRQRPATVEQMLLTGSPRTQALIAMHSMDRIRQAVTEKVQYLTVLATAQREIEQASAPQISHYQQLYQRQLPQYQFLGPLERDVQIAQAGFKPDHSNLRSVVKVMCQSPEMQRLEPDVAQEHWVGVLEIVRQRHRAEVWEQQRQERTPHQKGQGFEME